MVAAWELSHVIAAVHHGRALAGLRRDLDTLPETHHPLGL
jgi:hypothetical protein